MDGCLWISSGVDNMKWRTGAWNMSYWNVGTTTDSEASSSRMDQQDGKNFIFIPFWQKDKTLFDMRVTYNVPYGADMVRGTLHSLRSNYRKHRSETQSVVRWMLVAVYLISSRIRNVFKGAVWTF